MTLALLFRPYTTPLGISSCALKLGELVITGPLESSMITRRHFVQGGIGMIAALPESAQEVPNSLGIDHPKLKAPPHACDCHMHIYDPVRFPFTPNPRVAPTRAAVPQYRILQNRIGTTRVIVVTPRNYGVDNRATIDAIIQFGSDARGVAVLHPTVTDADLKKLHEGAFGGFASASVTRRQRS